MKIGARHCLRAGLRGEGAGDTPSTKLRAAAQERPQSRLSLPFMGLDLGLVAGRKEAEAKETSCESRLLPALL